MPPPPILQTLPLTAQVNQVLSPQQQQPVVNAEAVKMESNDSTSIVATATEGTKTYSTIQVKTKI